MVSKLTRTIRHGRGATVGVHDALLGVTLQRTVAEVVKAIGDRCTELSTEMERRAKIVGEKIIESKSASIDVETLRMFVMEHDPCFGRMPTATAIGEALYEAQVINLLDGMHAEYAQIGDLLKSESDQARTMQLYAHRDCTVMVPIDIERIASFVPKPMPPGSGWATDQGFYSDGAGPMAPMMSMRQRRPMAQPAQAESITLETFEQVRQYTEQAESQGGYGIVGS